jgi:hypothetical protein
MNRRLTKTLISQSSLPSKMTWFRIWKTRDCQMKLLESLDNFATWKHDLRIGRYVLDCFGVINVYDCGITRTQLCFFGCGKREYRYSVPRTGVFTEREDSAEGEILVLVPTFITSRDK